jgi:hypothetical protein
MTPRGRAPSRHRAPLLAWGPVPPPFPAAGPRGAAPTPCCLGPGVPHHGHATGRPWPRAYDGGAGAPALAARPRLPDSLLFATDPAPAHLMRRLPHGPASSARHLPTFRRHRRRRRRRAGPATVVGGRVPRPQHCPKPARARPAPLRRLRCPAAVDAGLSNSRASLGLPRRRARRLAERGAKGGPLEVCGAERGVFYAGAPQTGWRQRGRRPTAAAAASAAPIRTAAAAAPAAPIRTAAAPAAPTAPAAPIRTARPPQQRPAPAAPAPPRAAAARRAPRPRPQTWQGGARGRPHEAGVGGATQARGRGAACKAKGGPEAGKAAAGAHLSPPSQAARCAWSPSRLVPLG